MSINDDLVALTYTWIRKIGVSISRQSLSEQLLSHPDYPSLASIKDTLEKFSVTVVGRRLSTEEVLELSDVPFLARMKTSNGISLVCVEGIKGNRVNIINKPHSKQTIQLNTFFSNWTSIVLTADLSTSTPEHKRRIFDKKHNLLAFLPAVLLLSVNVIGSHQDIFIGLLSFVGMVVAYLTLLKEMGLENTLTHLVCGSRSACGVLPNVFKGPFLTKVKMSDLAFIYFVGVFLLWLIIPLSSTPKYLGPILMTFNILTLPFIIYSLYQQISINQYCRLCIITVLLLLFQFIYHIIHKQSILQLVLSSTNIQIIMNTIVLSWIALKVGTMLLSYKMEFSNLKIRHLKMVRDIKAFSLLHRQQESVTFHNFDHDLNIGPENAKLIIVAAINLFCLPCANVFESIKELIKTHNGNIRLTLRFKTDAEKIRTEQNLAIKSLLHLAMKKDDQTKLKLLSDWFNLLDYRKFSILYKTTDNDYLDDELSQHKIWFEENSIYETPTIILNYRKIPTSYSIEDLNEILFDLSNDNREIAYELKDDK